MNGHAGVNGKRRNVPDPNQTEFGINRRSPEHPFKLRAGDVIRYDGRLCRIVRVNECSAVVLMNQKVRDFKTRFDKPVRFQPPPKLFRISPNAEVEIITARAYLSGQGRFSGSPFFMTCRSAKSHRLKYLFLH